MAKIAYLLTQPKKDAENGRPCIFLSPWYAKILKTASQVFMAPKLDKKCRFHTFQSSFIIVNKIVGPTVSEIQMVRSVQTLIWCWKLPLHIFLNPGYYWVAKPSIQALRLSRLFLGGPILTESNYVQWQCHAMTSIVSAGWGWVGNSIFFLAQSDEKTVFRRKLLIMSSQQRNQIRRTLSPTPINEFWAYLCVSLVNQLTSLDNFKGQ